MNTRKYIVHSYINHYLLSCFFTGFYSKNSCTDLNEFNYTMGDFLYTFAANFHFKYKIKHKS